MKAHPFTGAPPAVKAGDRIEIRDSAGDWHPATAASEPRYDVDNAIGGWRVNWPAEAVRPAAEGER